MLITDEKQLTATTLTAILRQNGYLTDTESVKGLRKLSTSSTHTSRVHRFTVQYADARSMRKAPIAIFLKLIPSTISFAEHEVKFYTHVAPRMANRFSAKELPLPLCYDAHYDPKTGGAHLLLDDIAEKYHPAKDGMPPTERHTLMVLEGLARFHAYWWENPALGDVADMPTEASIAANEAKYRAVYDNFLAEMQYNLPVRHRQILDVLVEQGDAPERRRRLIAGERVTLVHRDTNPNNIMYAFDGVKLVDWQSWRADAGTDFIACHFSSQVRRLKEKPMLERYFNTLTRNRVEGYRWDDLWDDYRASIARCILFLLAAWTPQRGRVWWQAKAELALNAFDELDGLALYNR